MLEGHEPSQFKTNLLVTEHFLYSLGLDLLFIRCHIHRKSAQMLRSESENSVPEDLSR